MNNRYEIVVYWSEQDGQFLAEVPQQANSITNSGIRAKPLRKAEEVIDAYLATTREAAMPLREQKGRTAIG